MKLLSDNNIKTGWENRLLKDLTFIKRKGRYPLSKRTLMPSAFILFMCFFFLRMAWPMFFLTNKFGITVLVVIMAALGIGISIYQYYSVLSFKKIATPFHLQRNQELLQQFFQSQRLAYTQHPEAPEVFMILSKNLSMRGDYREVMIFISDDHQILVNSHFSGDKFTVTSPSRQYKQMAGMLKSWINIHIKNGDKPTTAVSHI